jgi:hypothetical protein
MHTFFSDRNMLVLEGEHNFDATWVSELQSNGSLVKHLLDFLLALVCYHVLCWTAGQVCIVYGAILLLIYSLGCLKKIPEKLGTVADSMKNINETRKCYSSQISSAEGENDRLVTFLLYLHTLGEMIAFCCKSFGFHSCFPGSTKSCLRSISCCYTIGKDAKSKSY